MVIFQYTATLLGSTREWDCFSTLPHFWGTIHKRSASIPCHTTKEIWVVALLLYTGTLPGRTRQWGTFCKVVHYWVAVGNGTLRVCCRNAEE